MLDHVHMMLSIPPKYAVSQVVGTSRARVRFIWHGYTGSASAISSGGVSGLGILCVNGGSGRAGHTRLHPESGAGGQALEQLHLWDEWPSTRRPKRNGAALATPHSRFERLTI